MHLQDFNQIIYYIKLNNMIKATFKTSKWSRSQDRVFSSEDKWNDYHKWYDENTNGVIRNFKIEPFDIDNFLHGFAEVLTETELQLIKDYLNNESDKELKSNVIKLINSKL